MIYFQGGQYILELVDFYGGTFMRLFAAIAETIGVFWIYGKLTTPELLRYFSFYSIIFNYKMVIIKIIKFSLSRIDTGVYRIIIYVFETVKT